MKTKMTNWVRFNWNGNTHRGIQDGDEIAICDNALFEETRLTGDSVALADVELVAPYTPSSILALWNNFHERAEAEGQTIPDTPLYFMKPVSSVIGPEQTIYRPRGHSGRVIFEAELGIVIGKQCRDLTAEQADEHIFGYTCVNDVTAIEFLFEDKAFQQWTRSKGYDSFTPLGPCITTDIDPGDLDVLAIQGEETRQNYPVSDMIYSPANRGDDLRIPDPGSGRPDLLRHLGRCAHHEARQRDHGIHPGYRRPAQLLRRLPRVNEGAGQVSWRSP